MTNFGDDDTRMPVDAEGDVNPCQDDICQEPSREPTTREKFSVLLPALLAFGGMILMLLIFLAVAIWRS